MLHVSKMTKKFLTGLFEQFVTIPYLHVVLFRMHITDPLAEADLEPCQI